MPKEIKAGDVKAGPPPPSSEPIRDVNHLPAVDAQSPKEAVFDGVSVGPGPESRQQQ